MVRETWDMGKETKLTFLHKEKRKDGAKAIFKERMADDHPLFANIK